MPLEFVTPASTSRTRAVGVEPVERGLSGCPVVGQGPGPEAAEGIAGTVVEARPGTLAGRRDHVALGLPGVVEQQEPALDRSDPSAACAWGDGTDRRAQEVAGARPVRPGRPRAPPRPGCRPRRGSSCRRPSRALRTGRRRRGRGRRPGSEHAHNRITALTGSCAPSASSMKIRWESSMRDRGGPPEVERRSQADGVREVLGAVGERAHDALLAAHQAVAVEAGLRLGETEPHAGPARAHVLDRGRAGLCRPDGVDDDVVLAVQLRSRRQLPRSRPASVEPERRNGRRPSPRPAARDRRPAG